MDNEGKKLRNELSRDCNHIKRFIFGRDAHFKILHDSGAVFEYRVLKGWKSWGVYTLRKDSLRYAGFIDEDMSYIPASEDGLSASDNSIKCLYNVLGRRRDIPDEFHVVHFGKCSVCGNKIKNKCDIELGIDSSCIQNEEVF